jgi:hypothetical protein
MEPIETEYKGYRFRSRLEARWATLFDWMSYDWRYEPQGVRFEDGTTYLPDFFIEGGTASRLQSIEKPILSPGFWIEIKGGSPTQEEVDNCVKLSESDSRPVFMFTGVNNNDECIRCIPNRSPEKIECVDLLGLIILSERSSDHSLMEAYHDAENALKEARSARFEHGESPHESETQQTASPKSEKSISNSEVVSQQLPEERLLLRLMLEHGTRMVKHVLSHMAYDEFTKGAPRELVQLLEKMYQDNDVRTQRILDGGYGDTLQKVAADIIMSEQAPSPSDYWEAEDGIADKPYKSADAAMRLLKLDRLDEAMDQVREKAYDITGEDEGEELKVLQQKMMSLQKRRRKVKRGDFLED